MEHLAFCHLGCELCGLHWFSVSSYRRNEFRLRFLQQETHVHLAVHRCGDRQVLGGLCPVTAALEQLAEAEVAVGGQRAHLEFVGPGEGQIVMPFG